jgi:hypothetical protein
LDTSLSVSNSASVRFDSVIDSVSLLQQLGDLGLSRSSDLWILLALDQAICPLLGNSLLFRIAQNLASICSPFLPTYKLDYSVFVESERDTKKAETIRTETTYRVQIRLPGAIFCSSATIPFSVDEYFDSHKRSNEIVAELKRYVEYEPHSDSDGISAITPVSLPVLTELLRTLTERQRDVVVRRNGLTGKIETLEEIAVDWDLTRERIRQIEERASKRIHHPSKSIPSAGGGTKAKSIPFKNFKKHIRNWVSKQGNVVASYEILDHFRRYIDFVEYSPCMSMAFLCQCSGVFVQFPKTDGEIWYAASSKEDYDCFARAHVSLSSLSCGNHLNQSLASKDSQDALAIMRIVGLDAIESIQNSVSEIIGASKVMRLEEFVSRLTREHTYLKSVIGISYDKNPLKPEDDSYNLLMKLAHVCLIEAAEYERIVCGKWVGLDLSERAQAIARAIIYADANQHTEDDLVLMKCLRDGVRSDFIVQDVSSRSGFIMNEHNANEICRRNPDVFIQTDENYWGVIGCGAVKKEQTSEKSNRDERIVDVMTRALLVTKDGLTIQELIRRVRETVPNASENTVKIYLVNLHRDRFEETANGKYVLSKRFLTHLADPSEQETVISLVIRVLKEADNPLYVDEIIERCQQRQFVAESAIRGYLAQNYRELFQKHEGGKYSLL